MNQLPEHLESIRQQLNFPLYQVGIAVRAEFRCEYCGKYLLESIEAYDSWQIDHIVPNRDNSPENLALTCKICNFAKRHSGRKELEQCKTRSERIKCAQQIISERISQKKINLAKVKEFAALLMKEKIEHDTASHRSL